MKKITLKTIIVLVLLLSFPFSTESYAKNHHIEKKQSDQNNLLSKNWICMKNTSQLLCHTLKNSPVINISIKYLNNRENCMKLYLDFPQQVPFSAGTTIGTSLVRLTLSEKENLESNYIRIKNQECLSNYQINQLGSILSTEDIITLEDVGETVPLNIKGSIKVLYFLSNFIKNHHNKDIKLDQIKEDDDIFSDKKEINRD